MRKKIFAIALLSLLTIVSFTAIMSARGAGQEGDWITSYKVQDAVTGQLLIEANAETGKYSELSPVLSGENITVTFTVNVFASGSGNLKLSTAMLHSAIESDRYWDLTTKDYDLGPDFNPNAATTEFNWVTGNFTMKCYGTTPTLSAPMALALVQIASTGGTVLDAIKPTVVTAAVDEFQNLYDSKENKLQSLKDSGVAAGYIQIYEDVLTQANSLVNAGYVSEAIALLNSLPTSGEPMGSATEMFLLPIIGIAAAGAVIFAFMFMRARGRNSYTQMVIEDQIKDLEGLTLRASKIDRRLSASLESVKDRLKSLVGM